MSPLFLLILLPLAGAMINAAGSKYFREKITAIVACVAVGSSLGVAICLMWRFLSLPAGEQTFRADLYQWFAEGALKVNIGLLVDSLSMVMTLIVLFIGFLIHIYSIKYMSADKSFNRFFIYLNLFIFFMLILVLADNLILTFVGWEGVGLCSYLLIGFWHEKKPAADAGRKAFIVNRIGDAGFVLGILLIIVTFNTVDYTELAEIMNSHHGVPEFIIGTASLLLLIGAMGKSAQFPLHVWLPDAMEGPTPVSALIHAATMVNAGVYLLCRISPMLAQAQYVLPVIVAVGLVTALYAALSAFQQKDIKRMLAYSTVSQIGFMFAAVGSGCYMASIFHLTTHGIFKGLLFLGAGAVIHALQGEQDIYKMGGVAGKLPAVSKTFLVGLLALAGVFPLSGFFSKDAVLWGVYESYGISLWLAAFVTALITALYCGKLYGIAFSGKVRDPENVYKTSSFITYPLLALAFCAVFIGVLGLPLLKKETIFASFLASSFPAGEDIPAAVTSAAHTQELILMLVAGAGVIVVIWRAAILYSRKREKLYGRAADFLEQGFKMDKLYDIIFVLPFYFLARRCSLFIDQKIIDGAVNGMGKISLGLGWVASRWQNGYTRYYAGSFVCGVLIFSVIVFWYFRG